MKLDDLRERIKDEVILRGGEIKDHEWRNSGLIKDADALGISEKDFSKLVIEESLKVDRNQGPINLLKNEISEAAKRSNRRVTDEDVKKFVADAGRIHLSRKFVEEQLIPHLISEIPVAALKDTPFSEVRPVPQQNSISRKVKTPEQTDFPAFEAVGPVEREKPIAPPNKTPEETGSFKDAQERNDKIGGGQNREPAIRTERARRPDNKFRSTSTIPREIPDANDLINQAFDLTRIFTANRTYNTLRRLAGSTIADFNFWHLWVITLINWLSIFLGALWKVFSFIIELIFDGIVAVGGLLGRSDFWRAIASIIRVAVVVGIVWMLWSWYGSWSSERTSHKNRNAVAVLPKAHKKVKEIKRKPSQSEDRLLAAGDGAISSTNGQQAFNNDSAAYKVGTPQGKLSNERPAQSSLAVPTPKQYEEIQHEIGQFGERQASKDGKWGLWSDKDGKWLIEPDYDDIGVFKNGKAAVKLNGQDFDIGRDNQRISN